MSDETLRLRQTWPDEPRIFHVVNEAGDTIGRISHDNHVPAGVQRWSWSLGAFNDRHRGSYAGRCDTREEAMAEVKALWPTYHADLEYDGVLERVRRERRGVPTRMFIYEDELAAAPAEIEALAGCLEGSVEEAQLSLLVQALSHQEDCPNLLRKRLTGILAERDRENWPSSRERRPSDQERADEDNLE